jgi:hypothetical protein
MGNTPLIETSSVPGKALLVTGKKRDGKSFYVYNRIFVPFKGVSVYIDPKGADPYIRGEVRHTVEDVKAHPANKIIFRPTLGSSPTAFDEEVDKLIDYLISWKQTYPPEAVSMLVVIDEAQRYMGKAGMMEGPDRLVQTCSALNISVCICNPDYMTVPRQLYVQSDYVIFFTAHKVLSIYLDERMMTEIPDLCLRHMEKNKSDLMSNKGHGCMYDWHSWWIINQDGSMDGPIEAHDTEGGEGDETDEDASDSGHSDATKREGTDGNGPNDPGSVEKPIAVQTNSDGGKVDAGKP